MRVVSTMGWARNRRGMRPGRRHVLQISLARPAPAADRRQALFIRREAAIGAAVAEEAAIIGAPRIILRAGAGRNGRGGDKDTERDEQRAHGGPPDASGIVCKTPDGGDYCVVCPQKAVRLRRATIPA